MNWNKQPSESAPQFISIIKTSVAHVKGFYRFAFVCARSALFLSKSLSTLANLIVIPRFGCLQHFFKSIKSLIHRPPHLRKQDTRASHNLCRQLMTTIYVVYTHISIETKAIEILSNVTNFDFNQKRERARKFSCSSAYPI